ncbi:MAG: hypothetical protein K0R63_1738 [Rickettsiales bacterium]|jgi:drug/metabolite transporter (DMT)-like permease|nr:hypothetical protein [Rickettsiales bacterium]
MIARIKQTHNDLPVVLQAIVWFIASTFFFSAMTAVIHYLSDQGLHPFTMVLFRNIFGLITLFPWVMKRGYSVLRTDHLGLHALRGITGIAGMLLWFYAISKMPLPEATALSYTGPLFTAIAAMIFLNEKMGIHRWTALLAGFVGVIIILHPGRETFNQASFLVIAATIAWALSSIIIKNLTKTERPTVIVFYMTLAMIPLSIPFVIPVFTMPNFSQFLWLIALGIASVIAQCALSHSVSKAPLSTLVPFDFGRLLFASIISYFAFDERLDIWTFTGAMVIFVSGVYIIRREARHHKELQEVIDS